MKRSILAFVVGGMLCAGFIGWRILAMRNQLTPHFEIVIDPSLSHPQSCGSLLGLAEQAIHAEAVSGYSTLTVLVLGDKATANEPWQLGRYSIPRTHKVLEGRTVNLRREEGVLSDIRSKCEAVHRTNISPIFMGVKEAVADLRARGCRENSHCIVFVDSDLAENVETSIKDALNRERSVKLPPASPVDNQGIKVSFCGLAVTTGRVVDHSSREARRVLPRDPGRDDRLRQVWRSLFSQPELVRFEPYCPMSK